MRAILAYAVIVAAFCPVTASSATARCKQVGRFPGTVAGKDVDDDRSLTLYRGRTQIMLKTYLPNDRLVLVVDPPTKRQPNCYRKAAHMSYCDYTVTRNSEGVYNIRVYNKAPKKIDYDLICGNR